MGMTFAFIALLISVLLPMFGSIYLNDLGRGYSKSLLGGVLTYAAMQLISMLPPFNTINEAFVESGLVLSVFAPALAMAILSEGSRAAVYKFFLVDRDRTGDCFSVGFAHWAAEAVVSVGLLSFLMVTNFASTIEVIMPLALVLTAIERLFVLPVYILLSMLTISAVKTKRHDRMVASVVIHTILNGTTGLLVNIGIASPYIIALMGVAALLCFFAIRQLNKSATFQDKEPKILGVIPKTN